MMKLEGNSCPIYNTVLFLATEIQNIQIADGDSSRGILVLFITTEHTDSRW